MPNDRREGPSRVRCAHVRMRRAQDRLRRAFDRMRRAVRRLRHAGARSQRGRGPWPGVRVSRVLPAQPGDECPKRNARSTAASSVPVAPSASIPRHVRFEHSQGNIGTAVRAVHSEKSESWRAETALGIRGIRGSGRRQRTGRAGSAAITARPDTGKSMRRPSGPGRAPSPGFRRRRPRGRQPWAGHRQRPDGAGSHGEYVNTFVDLLHESGELPGP